MTRAAVAVASAAIVLAVAACRSSAERPPAAVTPTAVTIQRAAGPAATASASSGDVTVDLRAPLRVRYVPHLLGPAKPTLGVIVTNRSRAPVDVSNLTVRVDAAREGVAFRCAEKVGAPVGEREPVVLQPGQSFTFERALDCALPLVGSYAVRVAVSFGAGEWAAPREVRAFTLRVAAVKTEEPRAVEGVTGLFAGLGASGVVLGGDTASGAHGRVAVAIVNGGRVPLELPPLKLALRVTKLGTPIPCEDEPTPLKAPRVLGAGAVYTEPIDVSCIGLGRAGAYDVEARLLQPGGADGDRVTELGTVRIVVDASPARRDPEMWPPRAP